MKNNIFISFGVLSSIANTNCKFLSFSFSIVLSINRLCSMY